MILARISQAIREQNWFAVAIEFFIVILGVVIGFQISASNAGRADRDTITRQLHEVRADVRADIEALEITLEASLWRLAAADYILSRLDGEDAAATRATVASGPVDPALLPAVTDADHPELLARANLIRGITGHRSGYESLVNAGNLRLIESDALRIAIQRYYAGYADLENNLRIYREIRAAGIPVLYRHGFSLFSDAPLDGVLAAAEEDPALTAFLRTGRELGLGQTDDVLRRQEDARTLLTLLDTELDP